MNFSNLLSPFKSSSKGESLPLPPALKKVQNMIGKRQEIRESHKFPILSYWLVDLPKFLASVKYNNLAKPVQTETREETVDRNVIALAILEDDDASKLEDMEEES